MKSIRPPVSLAAIASIALLAGVAGPAAHGEAPDTVDNIDVLAQQESLGGASNVRLSDAADVPVAADGGGQLISATIGDLAITVPVDPAEGIASGSGAERIVVGLPGAEQLSAGVALQEGVVEYGGENDYSVVPIVVQDGSIQINVVLEGESAPESFEFPIALPAGGRLELADNGTVYFYGAAGESLGGFLPPWAADAAGTAVPTHFEIDGATVVQVVEHHSAAYEYPVVADPYEGRALLASGGWLIPNQRFAVVPTDWGRVNGHNPHAVDAYMAEFDSRFPVFASNTQIRWQYLCHVQNAPLKSSWNLDLGISRATYMDYVWHACN